MALVVLLSLLVLGSLLGGAAIVLKFRHLTRADRKPLVRTPASVGLPYEEVRFPSENDGLTLRGWLIDGDAQRPVVVLLHGEGSTRDDPIGLLEVARDLYNLGYAILAFDFRGHGESDGDRFTGGVQEQWDVLGAVDFLATRGWPRRHIALLGFSLGAGVALLAAKEARVAAVIADSPFASLREMARLEGPRRSGLPAFFVPALLWLAKLGTGADPDLAAPEEAVKELGIPIFVIHGEADAFIPLDQGRRVYSASHHPASDLWIADGAKHVAAYTTYPQQYVDRVAAFLASVFKPARKSP